MRCAKYPKHKNFLHLWQFCKNNLFHLLKVGNRPKDLNFWTYLEMCLCILGFLSNPSPQKEQKNWPPWCRLCSCIRVLCDLVLCLSSELFKRNTLLQNEHENCSLLFCWVIFLRFDDIASVSWFLEASTASGGSVSVAVVTRSSNSASINYISDIGTAMPTIIQVW